MMSTVKTAELQSVSSDTWSSVSARCPLQRAAQTLEVLVVVGAGLPSANILCPSCFAKYVTQHSNVGWTASSPRMLQRSHRRRQVLHYYKESVDYDRLVLDAALFITNRRCY